MGEMQTATIQTDVPIGLLAEMQMLVEAGWFRDLDDLMVDALRRFVESRRSELMERFIERMWSGACAAMTRSSLEVVCDAGPA